jgi:hypothetical protein
MLLRPTLLLSTPILVYLPFAVANALLEQGSINAHNNDMDNATFSESK